MKRAYVAIIQILIMTSSVGAIEIYQGKTLTPAKPSAPTRVEQGKNTPVDRAKTIEVYKAGGIEVTPSNNNHPDTPTEKTAANKNSKPSVKLVENAANISAHGDICGVADPALRGNLLDYLAYYNLSAKDTSELTEIYDAKKQSTLGNMTRASNKGVKLCDPVKMEKLATAHKKLLAIFDNTVQRRNLSSLPSDVDVHQDKQGGQVKMFTKEDLKEMHNNDVQAGRTSTTISDSNKDTKHPKGNVAQKTPSVTPKTYNPDPYNTGGWNYNTNQSASPIWNPYQ